MKRETVEYMIANGGHVEIWSYDRKDHNSLGPAYVTYSKNGLKVYEEYCIDDMRHRADGPATTGKDIIDVRFYLNGERYSEKEYYEKMKNDV